MRLIAGDVGGTKTLLCCVEADGTRSVSQRFDSGGYATFDDLLREFQQRLPGPVDAACFAVAGPVLDQRAEITNLHWLMEAGALSQAFSIPRVSLINDFQAVAMGVPLLGEGDLHSLQRGQRDLRAPIGILGAGTGLGEAILVRSGDHYQVVATEGGHADFAPQDEEQTELFLELRQRYGHVSWERLVSGMGLVNIFTFLGGDPVSPAEVADLASSGDERAARAFEMFVDIYGAEAGNLGLRVLARGGIFLAGGVAAKNISWFTDGRFLESFLRKGRFRSFLETVPVDVIVNQEVGLLGAIAEAKRI